jgi:hypothetical protein
MLLCLALLGCGEGARGVNQDGPRGAALDGAARSDGPRGDGPRGDASLVPDAPRADAAGEADAGAGPDGATPGAAEGPYPVATQSPRTARVVRRVQEILRTGVQLGRRRDVFMKVGASNTATPWFLSCFRGSQYDLGGRAELEPVIARFSATTLDGGATSFSRVSLAATPGWHVASITGGTPSPLDQEIAAINPAWAIVMVGTNDVNITGVATYEERMSAMVKDLVARGIVPILQTLPPRADQVRYERDTRTLNAVLYAIARSEDLPLVDVHLGVQGLPDFGLQGDGIHLSPGTPTSCTLTAAGLRDGFPMRNLLTLESLRRLGELEAAPGGLDVAPPLAGAGTAADPLALGALPFAWTDDTTAGERRADRYACSMATDESGPERVVSFTLDAMTSARFAVYDRAPSDIDVHVLDGAGACLGRHDQQIDLALGPGSYRMSLDSFVSGGVAHAGWFRVVGVALP